MPLSEVTREHFDRMIRDGIPESRELDYKRARPLGNEAGKKEFLKDITAFANTIGGHVVIGLAEEGGVPKRIVEITDTTVDDEKLRLKNLIRDGVQPGLLGVEMHEVALNGGGFGLVIRVPRSWNPPHRVSLGGWNKFFLRHSSGADEMDVEQLRGVFLGGAEIERHLLRFRDDRLALIASDDASIRVASRPRLIVHVVPLGGTIGRNDVMRRLDAPRPMRAQTGLVRLNIDGTAAVVTQGTSASEYIQLFRDGRIEAVVGSLIVAANMHGLGELDTTFFREAFFYRLPGYLNTLTRWGLAATFYVFVSMQGVKGASLAGFAGSADRDTLKIEPLVIDTTPPQQDTVEWSRLVKPLMNALWNAFGHPACPFS